MTTQAAMQNEELQIDDVTALTEYQKERLEVLRDIRTKVSRLRTEASYRLQPRPAILGNQEQGQRFKMESYQYLAIDAALNSVVFALDGYISQNNFLS